MTNALGRRRRPPARTAHGAKAITNTTDDVARVLIVSTNSVPDVSEYPDVGKLGINTGDDEWKLFRPSDSVEYYD